MKSKSSLLSTKSIITATFILAAITLLSKATGFLRIQSIAAYFGATWKTDAFLTAFLIPECLYLFFTEGALASALVPLFSGYFSDSSDKEKAKEGQILLSTLSVIVLFTGIFIGLFIYLYRIEVATLLGPEFSTSTKNLASALLAIICGYIPLGLLAGLFQGYLNSRGHFLAPAAGPLFFNIVTISAAVFLSQTMGIRALAWAVLFGGFISLLINLVAMKLLETKPAYPDFKHEGLFKAIKLLVPVIFALILVQTQICIERMMASSLPEGSISSLNFAGKILNLPAGLLALTMATALLPSLARAFSSNDESDFLNTTTASHNILIFIVTPLALILSLCSTEIVIAAFKRGAFNITQALVTADVLFYYGLALIPLTGTFLLIRVFFASNDTKTPAFVKMIVTTINIVILSLVINEWGIITVPIAFLVMYTFNYGILLIIFGRKNTEAETDIFREMMICLLSAAITALIYRFLEPSISVLTKAVITTGKGVNQLTTFAALVKLVISSLIIIISYLVSTFILKTRIIESLKMIRGSKEH